MDHYNIIIRIYIYNFQVSTHHLTKMEKLTVKMCSTQDITQELYLSDSP